MQIYKPDNDTRIVFKDDRSVETISLSVLKNDIANMEISEPPTNEQLLAWAKENNPEYKATLDDKVRLEELKAKLTLVE